MNDHDWAHIDDGDPYDEVNNLPEIIGEDSDDLDVTPDFWAACSDDVVETDHDYVRDFPPHWEQPEVHDYTRGLPTAHQIKNLEDHIRALVDSAPPLDESARHDLSELLGMGTDRKPPKVKAKKIVRREIVEAEIIEDAPDTGTEIVKREPTKRVVIVYGRWPLPLPVARRGYTYETDLPLAVGDIVIVPPTAIRDSESEATVVQLGSDYMGWVAKIERMAEVLDTEDHAWYCTCRSCAEGGEGVEVR